MFSGFRNCKKPEVTQMKSSMFTFDSHLILLSGFDALQDRPKSLHNEFGRTEPVNFSLSQSPGTKRRTASIFTGAVLWTTGFQPRSPLPPPSQVRACGETERGLRAGARWRRRSAAVLCCLAFWCPRVVSSWFLLPQAPHSGWPLPLLQALSIPCQGLAPRGPTL